VSVVRGAGYNVIPIPGANAAMCALCVAGTGCERFLFIGFLPSRAAARLSELETLRKIPYPLVFYEAPHRVIESVDDMAAILGGQRSITIARELTKMFESIHRCTLADAGSWLREDKNRSKGEFVLVVEGAPPTPLQAHEIEPMLAVLLAEMPLKQAVKIATQLTGIRKNVMYEIALKIKQEVN
jgi:16S rRNA (cytidine1402-2'-O)-methyltransferase